MRPPAFFVSGGGGKIGNFFVILTESLPEGSRLSEKPVTMKLRLLVCLLLLLPLGGAAQGPVGVWDGTLSVNAARLRLVFRIAASAEGYTATLDSPDQGVRGIPVDSVDFRDGALSLRIVPLDVSFRGNLLSEGMLLGEFTQSGQRTMLMLSRRKAAARPQTPQPPFPYACREVRFPSRAEGVELAGTLTLPDSLPPRAAVVLVTGSGLQNRDEELFGHKPFLVIADRLTRSGIAVLRYDDRGFGLPKEEQQRLLAGATTDDFALDALGAFDWLRAQPGLEGVPCGILGHSEGGTIAFLAAAADPDVAFVVSLAGGLIPGGRISLLQKRRLMEQQGLDPQLVDAACRLLERCHEELGQTSQEELPARLPELKASLAADPGVQVLPVPLCENLLQVLDGAAASPWVCRFLTLDPSEAIRQAGNRPVLAVNGSLDSQVDPDENLAAIRQLLGDSGLLTVKEYPGLNHLLQPCETGDVSEYEAIEVTVSEEVLADLVAWLRALGR